MAKLLNRTILFAMIIAGLGFCLAADAFAIPETPTGVTAIVQSDKALNSGLGHIIFYWTDASTDETSFTVEFEKQGASGGSGASVTSTTTASTGTQYSLDLSSLDDASLYTFRVMAINAMGDYSYWGSHSNTTLDRTAPTLATPVISSGTLGNNSWYTTDVGLYINSSDAYSSITLEKHKSTGAYNAGSSSDTWTDTAESAKTWYGYAEDSQGNYRDALDSLEVKVDKTNPSCSANNSSSNWRTSNVTITLSASDAASGLASFKYRWDNSDAANGTATSNGATISIPSNGDYTLYLWAQDNSGRTSTWSGSYKLDTVNPTAGTVSASAESPYIYISGSNIYYSNAMTTDQTLTMTVTGPSDDTSGVQYVQFPAHLGVSSWQDTTPVYEKSFTINSSNNQEGGFTCTTADNAGRTANTNTCQIYRVINQDVPTGISFKTVSDGSAITSSTWQADRDPYIYWTAPASSTGIAEYQYKITNADTEAEIIPATSTGTNPYVQLSDSALASGKWRVRVRCRNNVQVWSSWSTNAPSTEPCYRDIYVDVTAPTGASISSIAPDSSSQLTVNAATGSDAHSGLNSSGAYWFNETTGNTGSTSSSSWQVSTAYPDSGLSENTQYAYQVKLRDNVGNESGYSSANSKYTLCDTPTGLTAVDRASNSVSLSVDAFSNHSAGSSGYKFHNVTTGSVRNFTAGANTWTDNTSLQPNAQYIYRVWYRNGDAVETAYQEITVRTKSASADAVCDKTVSTWYQGGQSTERFNFTSANLTNGYIAYYRYIWDRSPATAVTGGDTQWLSGTLSLMPMNSNKTYLHALPYNADGEAGTQANYGPYYFVDTSRLLKHKKFFDDDGIMTNMQ